MMVLRRTRSGYLVYLSFPCRCRAVPTSLLSGATFTFRFLPERNRLPEPKRIGPSSRLFLERVKPWIWILLGAEPNNSFGNPHHSLEGVSVRTRDDAASPDTYPPSHPKGIVQAGDQSDFDERIASNLLARSDEL